MKTLKLQRISYRKDCTLGALYDSEGDMMFATLELPDMDNIKDKACIPEGLYKCIPHNGEKKDVYEITNVLNRTGVLIHIGNTTDDIKGCVLIGRNFGKLKGKTAVISSTIAMEGLRKYIGKESFTLLIERV